MFDYRPSEMSTYNFRFTTNPSMTISNIEALGWDYISNTSYYWDGLKRKEKDLYLFQYTLDGYGALKIDDDTHRIHPGQAFLVRIPDNHVYYFPAESSHWEFVFIMLYGSEVHRIYENIYQQHGCILDINPESILIKQLIEMYHEALKNQIHDTYHSAHLAYRFCMELQRWSLNLDRKQNMYPLSVQKALEFMCTHYHENLSLEDIALASGLSKHHFGRVFQKYMNDTPGRYLIKKRIEMASKLLLDTDLTNREVADQTGFTDANYFCKVFRDYIGTSPQNYRHGSDLLPARYILFN